MPFLLSTGPTRAAVSRYISKSSAISFVQAFYESGRNSVSSNLPTSAELKASRKLFSARLRDVFMAAAEYQTRWMAQHRDEPSRDGRPPVIYKPPFVDGDIFTGSPDGSSRFVVTGATRHPGGRWLVQVRSNPQRDMSSWRVTVVLVVEDNHFAIDDVLYQSDEDDSFVGSLSENLNDRRPH